MSVIPTKQQWSGWTLPSKATYAGAWVGFISLLLFIAAAVGSKNGATVEVDAEQDAVVQAAVDSPGAVMQHMEHSPGSIQSAGDVVIHPQDLPAAELKTQIRTILQKINPEIIIRIDSGHVQIGVMIHVTNQQALHQFAAHPSFREYLELHGTGAQFRGVNRGGTIQIGNNLNDVNQSGAMDGYVLVIKPALRKEPTVEQEN